MDDISRQRRRPSAIAGLMRGRGITVAELADDIGVSRQHLSAVVNGRKKPARARQRSLARALGFDETELDRLDDLDGSLDPKRLRWLLRRGHVDGFQSLTADEREELEGGVALAFEVLLSVGLAR